jgi:hypothetical protein
MRPALPLKNPSKGRSPCLPSYIRFPQAWHYLPVSKPCHVNKGERSPFLKTEMRKSHFRYRGAESSVRCFAHHTGNHQLWPFSLVVLLQHATPEIRHTFNHCFAGLLLFFRARLSTGHTTCFKTEPGKERRAKGRPSFKAFQQSFQSKLKPDAE